MQGPDIDAAENMARQAFGACLCAVNALYSVVSKLGGPEVGDDVCLCLYYVVVPDFFCCLSITSAFCFFSTYDFSCCAMYVQFVFQFYPDKPE